MNHVNIHDNIAAAVPGALRGGQVRAAHERLRAAIIGGKLPPGTWLLETETAKRLDVSRSSARAALHRLQQEGFLEAEDGGARRRLRVTPATRTDFEELSEVVGELEGLAARRVASLPAADRREVVARLRERNAALLAKLESFPTAAGVGSQRGTAGADEAFHDLLVEAAGSTRLREQHAQVRMHLRRYEELYGATAERSPISVDEHEQLVAAIERGAEEEAAARARANFTNSAERLAVYLERIGDAGTW